MQTNIQCQKCKLTVKTANQLETHNRLKHTEIVTFMCEQCEFQTATKVQLEQHQSRKHAQEEISENPTTDTAEAQKSTEYVCSHCKETLATQELFEEHKLKHTAPIFKCDKYERPFLSETDLQIHDQTIHRNNSCQNKCKK